MVSKMWKTVFLGLITLNFLDTLSSFTVKNIGFVPRRLVLQDIYNIYSKVPTKSQLSAIDSVSTTVALSSGQPVSTRVQRVKDMIIQRQILLDISSCEFALRVELKTEDRKIDYSKLITKLDKNVEQLKSRSNFRNSSELIDRIVKTKEDLNLAQQGLQPKNIDQSTPPGKQSEKVSKIMELKRNLPILVREDGTVDWDNAWSSSREVARFGAELWERLNGKEEGIPSASELLGQVQARELKTPSIVSIQEKLDKVKLLFQDTIKARDDIKNTIRLAKKELKVVDEKVVDKLFRLDLRVRELKKLMDLLTLDLDLERICVYLEQELESSMDPSEQRQFVAEAALIDKQFTSLFSSIVTGSDNVVVKFSDIYSDTSSLETSYNDELISLIDDDELALIIGETVDLKSRLGIDTQSAFDWGSFGVVVSESVSKLKTGLIFYGDGLKLFVRDIQYLWYLLLKAAGGEVLKPREVNTIRRTGKDVLTLIPFTIILIIPLSPVGHVLAFSFIQKFFPDFFPSFFTEKRQNLKKLFSEIERKNEDELDAILSQDNN